MALALQHLLPQPLWPTLVIIVVRSGVVYLVLVALLRAFGKRNMGQMTLTDLTLILILSNAVQNAMVGPDTSLIGGLAAALTLLLISRGADRLSMRSQRLSHLFIGSPTLLVNDGEFVDLHLRREGITHEEVLMAIREHSLSQLSEVRMAVLEVDGSISIVPHGPQVKRTRRHFRQVKER